MSLAPGNSLLDELRRGLSAPQKSTPPALFYDALGSALFEAITLLPEYEVGRADLRVLERHALEALRLVPGALQVIELGPGHGRKARVLLAPLCERQASVTFVAVDVAAAAIEGCRRQLEDLPGVRVAGVLDAFLPGLARAPTPAPSERRLVLFLGSNLSNSDRGEARAFFAAVRAALAPGDALLLSADLDKAPERLLPAYDDALGVTAAFNKNVLARLNLEFGAEFELGAFAHEVRWNPAERRVEMHLRALRPCTVPVPRLELELSFTEGETLWTESSHRFSLTELRAWGAEAGMPCAATWTDEAWPLALGLFVAS